MATRAAAVTERAFLVGRRQRLLTVALFSGALAACGADAPPADSATPSASAGSSPVGSAGTAAVGASGAGTGSAGTPASSGAAGAVANAGATSANTGAGGASAGAATGGVPPTAGAASAGTTAGGAAGSGPVVVVPPVRDTASKVPISPAPSGYTVEGNFAYGPLTAQRIDVLYPNGGGPKATEVLPVVLMFHGGAWIHSYTNNYGSGKDHMTTFHNRFLSHGFIVCNAEYRVNDDTPDGAVAPAAVEDALLAAQWCWNYLDYFHGDRSKFVVTGASAGGHLALMVGLTTPAAMLGPTSPSNFKIAAIVSGYGPADIEAEINAVAKGWIPTNLPNRAAVAKLVNPITYVRKEAPPLIVVQGANDNTAPVKDSQRLVTLLTEAGAEASIHLVPGAAHGFDNSTWPDAEKAMFDWLKARGIGK